MMLLRKITAGLFLLTVVTYSTPQWVSIGLKNKKVNCIALDTRNNLIAGTNDSLYLKESGDNIWHPFLTPQKLSYVKIVSIRENYLAVITSNGTNSDGLYLLIKTLQNAPFYTLKKIDSLRNPEALSIGENCLVLGAANSLYKSIRDTGSNEYMPLIKLKTPPYCFGVEMPMCADIHSWKSFGGLFAGGYDRSPMSNPGRLIMEQKDSMVIFLMPQITNITSLASGYDRGSAAEALYVGTRDTQVVVVRPSTGAGYHIVPSPNKEAVRVYVINDSLPLPMNTTLIGMTNSGVFVNENKKTWKEIGDLPDTAVQCVYKRGQKGKNTLYAATNTGVYAIEFSTPVSIGKNKQSPLQPFSCKVSRIYAGIQVSFSLDRADHITISVYTSFGKTVASTPATKYASGKHTVTIADYPSSSSRPAAGVFFIKVDAGKRGIVRKICRLFE